MKVLRKIIQIDEDRCDGCGQCILSCAEGALQIVDGKAKVISDKFCDGLGACLGECPTDALKIIEREADEFDEAAVEELLSEKHGEKDPQGPSLACGCPSTTIRDFAMEQTPCQKANAPARMETSGQSALSHWPIQIRLVPPNAKFLENADLLVLADCAAVAFAGLHQELLKGRVVMMGCPKSDETDAYVQKFTAIFKTVPIKSVTTVFMEVPCCSGLPMIVKKAMAESGKNIPLDEITIGVRGDLLESRKPATSQGVSAGSL
ncbi:MAG: 4Fe-4S dicluster domain-containing protein [Desulfobacteraceae bacterium]|nr:4Fe-4S dicluster domain-containing protein [Desulfobacteraceae bacterium]